MDYSQSPHAALIKDHQYVQISSVEKRVKSKIGDNPDYRIMVDCDRNIESHIKTRPLRQTMLKATHYGIPSRRSQTPFSARIVQNWCTCKKTSPDAKNPSNKHRLTQNWCMICADQIALFRQVSLNVPICHSSDRVKWDDLNTRQKGHQRKSILFRLRAVVDAEFQFSHCD